MSWLGRKFQLRLTLWLSIHPRSRSLHSTDLVLIANAVPCTSSPVLLLLNRASPVQHFTAQPSTHPDQDDADPFDIPTPRRDGLSPRPRAPTPRIGFIPLTTTIQPPVQLPDRLANTVSYASLRLSPCPGSRLNSHTIPIHPPR
jgi:hypothetical protein